MPCVRLPSHLHRSPYGVYHFRLVLPAALAEAAGTREIWRSLRTKDPVRATLLAYSLNIRFKLLLMAKPTVQDLLKLTRDEFQQLTIKGLQVGGFRAESVHLDNSTPEAFKRDQEALHGLLKAFASVPPIPPTAEEIAAAEAEAETDRKLRESARTKPLEECIPLYLSSKGGLAPSSRKDYENGLMTFARWANEATPIGLIDWDTMRGYFDFLRWLPTNYEKRREKEFGNVDAKTFVFEAQRANKRPEGTLKIGTLMAQQRILSAFFDWAKEARLYKGDNPALGQVKYDKMQKAKNDAGRGYLTFEPDEIKRIFAPEHFQAFRRPDEYWTPLLGLYTGARLNELSQLRVSDVTSDDTHWYITIQPDHTGDDATETRVKTLSSIRTVPIHPDLIALGFLDYCECIRRKGYVRLFPYLNRDAKGKFDKDPGRSFANLLDAIGITERRKTFHSLRKTIIRRMKRAKVEKVARAEFAGHGHRDTHEADYAGDYEADDLAALTVDAITYPELDLAALKRPANAFDAYIVRRMDQKAQRAAASEAP